MSSEALIAVHKNIQLLKDEIKDLTFEISSKEMQIRRLEACRRALENKAVSQKPEIPCEALITPHVNDLTNDDIDRYSRQLLLPKFGVAGQLKLKSSSFLIVGVGGLGCPAAQYLLAAGCGNIGLVDYDDVERSNFHRQTLHTEEFIRLPKVVSAQRALEAINPNIKVETYQLVLNSGNAFDVIEKYDVVLDCTDNMPTRYLLNDACVIKNKPLVSGSALQMDGQLTVYNYDNGPCYRCLYPVPPPPETVTKCGDGGVLGAVTGVIGSLQALEAIKIVIGTLGDVMSGRLLIFDGSRGVFRNIKLRGKRPNCDVCSSKPSITHLINYEQFCGSNASDRIQCVMLIPTDERLTIRKYLAMQTKPHLLIDVRSPNEFEICRLPKSHNVPLKQLLDGKYGENVLDQLKDGKLPVVVVCRRGNDSQLAVQHLRSKFPNNTVHDIMGGLYSWHYHVDKNFPIY